MRIIGLTGQTGSGKSSIAKIFAGRGAYVIDADEIAHEVLLPGGGAYGEVVNNLGPGVLDENGFIDRKKVAEIVFADPDSLKIHTTATHKHILTEIYRRLEAAAKSDYKTVVIDAPLLVESGLHLKCDSVWAARANDEIRLKRITERDGIPEAEARRRMASQTPFCRIAAHADAIIVNDGSLEELSAEVIKRMTEC